MLSEALSLLEPQPGQYFIDATLGGGGYSEKLLEAVGPNGKVLAIDLDEAAINNFRRSVEQRGWQDRTIIVHGNFANLASIVRRHDFGPIRGIVADIGISSFHLDESGRGISFQKREPLDMRFDQRGNTATARFILEHSDEQELVRIFQNFGEEKYARRMAQAVARRRLKQSIHYTTDLVEAIVDALPKPAKHKWAQSSRRIFQALRIAVNHELENLEQFLPSAFDLLAPAGRLAVVTFHSLEDRMVKRYFAGLAKGCVCPPDFPLCRCGRNPEAKILTKKPVTAGAAEQAGNPRSRSAKLRAVQKI